MSLGVVGQRCLSEREPELGLGLVMSVDRSRIGVRFPASGEQRLYALGTSVLKRVQFRAGETIALRTGSPLLIEAVEDVDGLLFYTGGGRRVAENAISDVTSVGLPPERLMAGQVDPGEVFDLRLRALHAQARFRQSEVRGFLGGRIELIPHQFYILKQVSTRQVPRVLLADEVGLGKTIEACLIIQRLLAVGRAQRVLILVPESLTHQWFVELLRRFNLWFSIYDEPRCLACEQSDPGQNPFLAAQLVLCSVAFLAGENNRVTAEGDATTPADVPAGPDRGEQALAAGWDMVVVDEAHHLQWSETAASPEYAIVDRLAQRSAGLLLLTATPTQLGLEGHFARLRLLDPARYNDYPRFQKEARAYGRVAEVAGKIIESTSLAPAEVTALRRIFDRDAARLDELLEAFSRQESGSREALLRTLLDQHGTGRVVFRNTRAAISGFPRRELHAVPLPATSPALLNRTTREFLAEETGADGSLRLTFKDDPRIPWLLDLLSRLQPSKVLLICRSTRKVVAIEAALKEHTSAGIGLFHEGLPLVQRDRQAAWFAEPDGAQILLCSEIGSEGRNFQFAHHLVLFDLPINPGLLEQRIGRLDRIGQTETIRIYAPVIEGSAEARVLDWYHRGLDAFQTPQAGGSEYQDRFREPLLALTTETPKKGAVGGRSWEALISETVEFREKLTIRLRKGRDRLLELNSFDSATAQQVIEQVRSVDADPFLRSFLPELLDHFGVRIKEHEEGDVFLDPSHAYIEAFPSIPREGMLATFSRTRAIAREDIRFLSPDHPLIRDAMDLLVDSPAGTTAFSFLPSTTPNLLLEAVFLLETVADSRWHVDQFLAPTPVRVLVDLRGQDHSASRSALAIAGGVEDSDLRRFLEKAAFNAASLKALIAGAGERAADTARGLTDAAEARAVSILAAEIQRLTDLRVLNDHIRPEEIALAQEQLLQTREAIRAARLRLDSIRLIIEGPRGR